MKRLYFIRHGESEFNRAKIWNGPTDTPLTTKGRKQAKQTGEKLKKEGLAIDAVITSPLKRAHDTALLVLQSADIPIDRMIVHDQLVERDFGKMEGRRDLVATTRYVFDEAAIDPYDGVERLIDLQKRMNEFLSYLHNLPHDTILVVGHGGSGRALRRAIRQEPLSKRGKSLGNAELVRFI
jgi:broad specificity phosphatase PhoE